MEIKMVAYDGEEYRFPKDVEVGDLVVAVMSTLAKEFGKQASRTFLDVLTFICESRGTERMGGASIDEMSND